MKVTVCELPNQPDALAAQWERLAMHTRSVGSDLLLLPEMPFYRWLPATRQVDATQWAEAVACHRQWLRRLPELGAAAVVGTRPVTRDGAPYNEGFVWSSADGPTRAHTKFYLPDEAGFWEASWYRRGCGDFRPLTCGEARLGFLICSELWFCRHARTYGRQGVHILVCPRATPMASVDKWIAGGRTAAVVSGAFCLSSNLAGPNVPGLDFAGSGWIIEPEEGTVLGTTASDEPFLTMEIDLAWAEQAKTSYPRYIPD